MNTAIPYTGMLDSHSVYSAGSGWTGVNWGYPEPKVSATYQVVQMGGLWFYSRVLTDGINGSSQFFGPYTDEPTANEQMLAAKANDGF